MYGRDNAFGWFSRPDISRLLIQWAMVAVVTGGLIITFKDKKPKYEQKQ